MDRVTFGRKRNSELEAKQSTSNEKVPPRLLEHVEKLLVTFGRGRPSTMRHGGPALMPVEESALLLEAKLAPVVVSCLGNGGDPYLRPLSARESRDQ